MAATKLTTVVHGIVEHVPVPFPMDNPDACKNCGITCPIKGGESLKYKTSIFVKPAYPSVCEKLICFNRNILSNYLAFSSLEC